METPLFEQRIDIQRIHESVQEIRHQIGRVVVGQEQTLDLMLVALLSDGHILLEGVPGVAKTLTAKLLARTIAVDFSRIQFTPDLMPSDVMGTNVFNPQSLSFEFRKGPIFSQIVLIDEINRAPAKTQAALFEVMEERTMTVDGTSYQLGNPFMVIATQNPVEHEGTYQLPEAQLDRFAFKLIIHYPNLRDEVEILNRHHHGLNLHKMIHDVQAVLRDSELQTLRETVAQVNVEPQLIEYIATIVHHTRSHAGLILGGSPRASVTILNTSKALASIRGRDFVTPDDIAEVCIPALRHRIALTAEKEMDGISPDDIIREIMKGIEIPRK